MNEIIDKMFLAQKLSDLSVHDRDSLRDMQSKRNVFLPSQEYRYWKLHFAEDKFLLEEMLKKIDLIKKFSDLTEFEKSIYSEAYMDEKLTHEQKEKYWKLILEDEKLLPKRKTLTPEERGYRRGITHGFELGFQGKTTRKELQEWKNSNESSGPPGSSGQNYKICGCFEEDEEDLSKSEFGKFMPD